MNSTERNLVSSIREQVADSDALLQAFTTFFSGVTEGVSDANLIFPLLRLRRARAIFERSRARLSVFDKSRVTGMSESTLLPPKYSEIARCEEIFADWVSETRAQSEDAIFSFVADRLPALFDPDIDIVICSGNQSDANREVLKDIGFRRVYSHNDLSLQDTGNGLTAENARLDDFVASIPQIDILPPRICTNFYSEPNLGPSCSQDKQEQILHEFRNSLMRVLSTRSTLNKFGDLWTRNSIRNRLDWLNYKDLGGLRGMFADRTAYVVGPAPSLTEHAALLRDASKTGLVICLSQALRKLREHGITPHFVIVTDAMYMPEDFGCNLEGVWGYVFDIVTDPRQRPKGSALLFPYVSSELKLHAYRDLWGTQVPCLPSWGSVSHSAISLAMLLGANKIALVGHDFCFVNGEQYSRLESGQPTTYLMDESSKGKLKVRTYAGHMSETKLDYDMFRVAVGKMAGAAKKKGVRFFNTSRTAAVATDVDFCDLAELVENDSQLSILKAIDEPSCPSMSRCEMSVDSAELARVARIVRSSISEILIRKKHKRYQRSAKVALRAAGKISRKMPGLSMLLQENLAKVDERMALADSDESRDAALCDFLTAFETGIQTYRENFVGEGGC